MFPAARKGDPITHDLVVPCGVIGPPVAPCTQGPVMIEFLPAAHVNCTVVCTGVISGGIVHPPPPPTPPVPIVKGSLTVLIHGLPAARWSPAPDTGGCGVFLGDPKLAAARTVLIGDSGGAGGGAPGGGGGGEAAQSAAEAAQATSEAAAPGDAAAASVAAQNRAAAQTGAAVCEVCPDAGASGRGRGGEPEPESPAHRADANEPKADNPPSPPPE